MQNAAPAETMTTCTIREYGPNVKSVDANVLELFIHSEAVSVEMGGNNWDLT